MINIVATIERITENLKSIDKMQKLIDNNPMFQDTIDEAIAPVKINLNKDINLLKSFMADSGAYSGMARQYINEFLNTINLGDK